MAPEHDQGLIIILVFNPGHGLVMMGGMVLSLDGRLTRKIAANMDLGRHLGVLHESLPQDGLWPHRSRLNARFDG